jgi:hypothetical protein
MRAVLRNRLHGAGARVPGLGEARRQLITALGLLIARYTGAPDPAGESGRASAYAGLARLARTERHWRHRLYWAATLAREGRAGEVDLAVDPVVRIWQRAFAYVTTGATAAQRRRLLSDWRGCQQLLVRRPAPRSGHAFPTVHRRREFRP